MFILMSISKIFFLIYDNCTEILCLAKRRLLYFVSSWAFFLLCMSWPPLTFCQRKYQNIFPILLLLFEYMYKFIFSSSLIDTFHSGIKVHTFSGQSYHTSTTTKGTQITSTTVLAPLLLHLIFICCCLCFGATL